ncbi:hypothetical protein GQ55_3G006900 [Panicum hallii var. hallii]|uniref:Plant bHLH transcription factor ACT-like domain-containing protein n=1 Tax=Panicum hallii var. hallii TaxID=1504633 RepID=A0A2T7E4F0_9POAL|nr:hypothetical protein GQ55_3G006900 [Panicum hallii var. hallii]
MSGKEKKLQLLRSVTKSNVANKTSILVDASKYIKELKDKVEEAAAASSAADTDSSSSSSSGSAMAAATVRTYMSVSSVDLDNSNSSCRRGFRINVSMERTRPGLLVSVLEAFEDLGLDVLDADVSCADDTAFRLQALGSGQGQQQGGGSGSVDEQKVRQAVLQAISKCMNDDGDE